MHKLHRIYRYALFLVGRFKYLVLFALIAFLFSTTVLYIRHPDQAWAQTRKGLPETAFGVFELMFASQPSLPYPKGDVLCQIIFFALPVLNMLGLAAAVAKFSQILFDRGLYNRAQAETADGHVILCGLGRLGREVLRQLDQRHNMKRRRDVVVVDSGTGVEELDSDLIRREPIIPVIRADMTHAATLREAGIERAAAVVILTGNDTPNLECALLAHEINPRARVVVRMSNKRISQRLDSMLRHSQLQNFQLIDSVEGSAPECLARAMIASQIAPSEGDQPPGGAVIICGLGRLGIGVVRLLKGRCPLTVIDSAPRPHFACEPAVTTAHVAETQPISVLAEGGVGPAVRRVVVVVLDILVDDLGAQHRGAFGRQNGPTADTEDVVERRRRAVMKIRSGVPDAEQRRRIDPGQRRAETKP